MKPQPKISRWEISSRIFTVIQLLVILVGCYFTVVQIGTIQELRNDRYMQYVFKFNKEFSDGKNHLILLAIQNGKPILKNHGGSFTEDDLDSYLGIFEDLYQAFKAGLINEELIYNDFSDLLTVIDQNQEIQRYLVSIRKEDKTYYEGFSKLVALCSKHHSKNSK